MPAYSQKFEAIWRISQKLKCIGAIRDLKYMDSGLKIVFFEEDEGTRLETVWEARNVPKLGEGVLYHYM